MTRAHARAWKHAGRQTHCAYCRHAFSKERPPTRDHVVPVSEGGTLKDGFHVVCQECNAARACVPISDYINAVEAEHELAAQERRSYRRPKGRSTWDGQVEVTSLSKREWRVLQQELAKKGSDS